MLNLLQGVRIVEQGTFITGPCAGMMLADLGADVIKVESPETGDPYRSFRKDLYSPHFQAYNRNKRSIGLDLRNAQDRDVFDSLIRSADVYVQNFRPGAAGRIGADWERLRSLNPRLVYCSISGFGEGGPYAHRPSYDSVTQALSGFLGVATDSQKPRILGPAIADSITGVYAALGIASALVRREKTGEGCLLSLSMLEAMMHYAIEPFAAYFALGTDPVAEDRPRLAQAFIVTCADRRRIALHLSSLDKFWTELVAALDAPGLAADPRFGTRLDRIDNYPVLLAALDSVFEARPRSEWLARLAERDVPYSPVNAISETVADPQVEWLGMVVPVSGRTAGASQALRPAWRVDGERDGEVVAAPLLDQHGASIRQMLAADPVAWPAAAAGSAA